MTTPVDFPEKGFYYHNKHDVNGKVNNYAYQVLGVSRHTEDDCRPQDKYMVTYLPLYESATSFREGKLFDGRPLEMFVGTVEKEGKSVQRFLKITDIDIIEQLKEIKKNLYGDEFLE